MSPAKSICVFCSASSKLDPKYVRVSEETADEIAARNWELVYGGGRVGLMGVVADRALEKGARVCGVIPHFLQTREILHEGLTETVLTSDMFERKKVMLEKSDAFIILPGGMGTLDEAMEVITLKQLQIIDKPVVFLDLDGFWQPLMQVFESLHANGFVHSQNLEFFTLCSSIKEVFQVLDKE